MGKRTKTVAKSAAHQLLKTKAKNRVDDLQGMFTELQNARKDSRASDVAVLEEQVHQLLREWKTELHEESPTTSLLAASLGSSVLSSDMRRLLQLNEEEDDATSVLASPDSPKLRLDETNLEVANPTSFQEDFIVEDMNTQEQPTDNINGHENILSESITPIVDEGLDAAAEMDNGLLDLHQVFSHNLCLPFDLDFLEETVPEYQGPRLGICPPPAAFLGPKCALWDCPRPAQGSEWCQDYCSDFHGSLALSEGPQGMSPVLRPGGIELKDGPLFAALGAKTLGKAVGIPECEGAATAKSPWNAPELFDLFVLQGEVIREWLFFDKPRRAFESGNRKQRSLPDYCGRGWHESRKQIMKDFGGLKRSYYMDPQPSNQFEWHLYEYEMNNCDACALYRLELKQVDSKKNAKGKLMADSVVDLQHKIGVQYGYFVEETDGYYRT
ncbi:hypothetical protein SUGI_0788050 [Cryptomeria japonica]|nr:hypothetical protein SUGI_0788050 [Cryptomeria japonica]